MLMVVSMLRSMQVIEWVEHSGRCQASAAADDANLAKTLEASQNLQEVCAERLGRSTADLIKSRQTQGVPAGRLT